VYLEGARELGFWRVLERLDVFGDGLSVDDEEALAVLHVGNHRVKQLPVNTHSHPLGLNPSMALALSLSPLAVCILLALQCCRPRHVCTISPSRCACIYVYMCVCVCSYIYIFCIYLSIFGVNLHGANHHHGVHCCGLTLTLDIDR